MRFVIENNFKMFIYCENKNFNILTDEHL